MPPALPAPLAWLFVDMNSFFASAEKHMRPELRHRPVGVVPVESEATCIIAASVDAKQRGVRTGTPVPEARRLCPGIELVRARPAEYVRLHHAVAASIERCAPIHKAYSIDEWAVRLGIGQRGRADSEGLARAIKLAIHEDHSRWLCCSVGIAPTRLLAKIASDIEKPDGLTVLGVEDLPGMLRNAPVQELCGIGPGIASRLERAGVRTTDELWTIERSRAIQLWGSIEGGRWWDGFHGVDEPEIRTKRRSMSHASVLDPKFRTDQGAFEILTRLVCRLGVRLRQAECVASGLNVWLLRMDGSRFSDAAALDQVQDTPTLLERTRALWSRRPQSRARPIQVGAAVFGVGCASQVSGCLFADTEKPTKLSRAMDEINRRWGWSSVYVGTLHNCRHHMDDKIAFGRIPQAHPSEPNRTASSDRHALKRNSHRENTA